MQKKYQPIAKKGPFSTSTSSPSLPKNWVVNKVVKAIPYAKPPSGTIAQVKRAPQSQVEQMRQTLSGIRKNNYRGGFFIK